MNKAGQLLGLPADLLGKNLLSVHLEWTSNPKTNFSLADHVKSISSSSVRHMWTWDCCEGHYQLAKLT